jgi:hypothetical protein
MKTRILEFVHLLPMNAWSFFVTFGIEVSLVVSRIGQYGIE